MARRPRNPVDYRHGTGPKQRIWNELEKKLYNLSVVVERYQNETDIGRIKDALRLVSEAKRLYPSPRMAGIRGIDYYMRPREIFDANRVIGRVLYDAQYLYSELNAKYLRLVSDEINTQQIAPSTVRYSENIQRERYLRKRAFGGAYARGTRQRSGSTGSVADARKRVSSGGAFPLDQLPKGVARLVAAKLGNTNLASYAASSRSAHKETAGLLAERLEPYKDFMATLLDDIKYYSKDFWNRPDGAPIPPARNGWKRVARRGRPASTRLAIFTKTTTTHPLVQIKLTTSSLGLGLGLTRVEVREKTSKAKFSLKYEGRYTMEFRWVAGSLTSDFIRRSHEALRHAAKTRRLHVQNYQPAPAPYGHSADGRRY
jgi:hypothetical protein